MYGMLAGLVLFSVLYFCGVVDQLWIVWGSLIGFGWELAVRCLSGDVITALGDLFAVIAELLDSFSDSGGDS